jgi:hypothetical protein
MCPEFREKECDQLIKLDRIMDGQSSINLIKIYSVEGGEQDWGKLGKNKTL